MRQGQATARAVFYHASNLGDLRQLLPLSAMHGSGEKVCFVTSNRAYALFYLRDMDINYVTCGVSGEGIVLYEEQFLNQLETIYQGRSGYLYTCADNSLVEVGHTRGVWVLKQPAEISNVEFIKDVYAEILQAERDGKVAISRFDAHSDEKRAQITKSVAEYIVKNDFLTSDSPKARFFAKNFPQAWELAESCS